MPKVKEKAVSCPIYPIEAWSVQKYGVKLNINPSWSYPLTSSGYSLDVEDDEQGNFVGLGLYCPLNNECYYWSDFRLAKKLLLPKFIAHNGVSDIKKLKSWGFNVTEDHLLWDTFLMGHILDSSRKAYGLKKLVKEDLGIVYPSYDSIVGKRTEKQSKPRITLDKQPLELVAAYNACDTYTTYKLYEKQKEAVNSVSLDYFNRIEKPCAIVFDCMSNTGVRIDQAYLRELKDTLEGQRKPLIEAITKELGQINLNSPKQLIGALNAKGITPQLKGKPSTDKRALEGYRSTPIVESLLKYSELDTLLSSFVTPYLEREEIVHPKFNQCGTRTGRPSCSNPNLLQIPKRGPNGNKVRRMFIARPGCVLADLDFGQIEPRLMAHLSKDESLCKLFNDGVDFHSFTADRLSISRDRAKILNLSVGYRATYKSVSQQMKCSWDEAQKLIDKWWSQFPGLYDWEQRLIHESKKSGYCTTLMGRRIKVDELSTPNQWRREGAERQLINNIAQGSAAEVMKLGMIEVAKQNISILVQVYDSLLIESPEESISADVEIAIDKLITSAKLCIPLTVDAKVGLSWGTVA